MSFVWPEALWLLLLVPVLVALYILLLRRKSKAALRFASVALLREAMTGRRKFRRHVPPAVFLLAMVVLIVAVARPQARVTLPSEQRTIIMAIDVSLSMRANDILPTRIAAARDAAKIFIAEQPSDVRIGIVTFAGSATLVTPPTHDREELTAAIDRLQLQVHTAIGSGIIMALAALFPDEGLEAEAETSYGSRSSKDKASRSTSLDKLRPPEKKDQPPVPAGSFRSGAIILLTDGRRTIGPEPLDAARMAADRGVKVYAVGFGTPEGGTADIGGRSIYVRFDAETLQAIAQLTGAEYFQASSAADLKKVYEGLNARYVLERRQTEISALLSALAALLVIIAASLSLWWFNRSA